MVKLKTEYYLRLTLFVSIILIFDSCKKEYTCHCMTLASSSGFEGDVKIKSTKSGEEACSSMNKTIVTSSGTETTTCTLK